MLTAGLAFIILQASTWHLIRKLNITGLWRKKTTHAYLEARLLVRKAREKFSIYKKELYL